MATKGSSRRGSGRETAGSQTRGKPTAASQKDSGNTRRHVYLDTFNTSTLCKDDRKAIATACAPKSEPTKASEKAAKKKWGGFVGLAKETLEKIDDAGRKYYGYQKGSPSGNEWMDDHCGGLWAKPGLDMEGHEDAVAAFKRDLDRVDHTIKQILSDPGYQLKLAAERMAEKAIDKFGYESVRNMALKKFGTDAALSLLPTKAGALGKLATIGKAGLSGAGYLDLAKDLASALGTPDAQDLLKSMELLLGKGQERFSNIDSPDDLMAELMSLKAELDPCLRAKKCQFTPFDANKKGNASKGGGCCPGQTSHHVIPHSAAKDAGCKDANDKKYTYGSAPTICLEGDNNTNGSHGRAHIDLGKSIKEYNGEGEAPKPISYEEMRDKALQSIKGSTEQCNQDCLKAQLDAYYQKCNKMIAKSGQGGPIPGEKDKPGSDQQD